MPSRNKVFMLGNLTSDVELTYTPNQTAVADFGLAVNRRWTGSNGETQESVSYIRVRAFGKLAENCSKYIVKGSLVDVEGRLDYEQWESRKGNEKRQHSMHRLVAMDVQFLPNGKKHEREPGEDPPEPDDVPY